MTTHWWEDDSQLLAALADALDVGSQAPPTLVRDAKALYTWRLIDAEIAQLTYDSTLDNDAALAGMRAQTAPLRMLTFQSADVTIELGVSGNVLTGQVVPPEAGSVEVRDGDTVIGRVDVDDLGCFSIAPVPRVAFSLRVIVPNGRTVITPVVSL